MGFYLFYALVELIICIISAVVHYMRMSCLFECRKITVAEISDMSVTSAFVCCWIVYMFSQVMFYIHLTIIKLLWNTDNLPIILV